MLVDSIDPIQGNRVVVIDWNWQLNQFSKEYLWLSSRRFQDMRWTFEIQQVLFTDGSIWRQSY
jgi:hypothetical protein